MKTEMTDSQRKLWYAIMDYAAAFAALRPDANALHYYDECLKNLEAAFDEVVK